MTISHSSCRSIVRGLRELALFPISPFITRLWAGPLFHIPGRVAGAPELSRETPSTILVIRQDGIGDMILTSGFLRGLRRRFPDAHIMLACSLPAKELVETCPYVDDIMVFPGNPHQRRSPYRRFIQSLAQGRALRKRNVDLCVLPRWSADAYHTTYLAYFSGARRRVGFRRGDPERELWNRGYELLLTDTLDDNRSCHDVLHMKRLLSFLGQTTSEDSLELWLTDADAARATDMVGGATGKTPAPRFRIAVSPGASLRSKCWPIESFSALLTAVGSEWEIHWVVIGGASDRNIADALCADLTFPVLNVTGTLSLRETAAVLKQCDLLISNDSAAVHLAAGVGTPCVVLSWRVDSGTLSSEDPFAPWGVPSATVGVRNSLAPCQGDCQHHEAHCIATISPDDVLPAVRELLFRTARMQPPRRHG